MLLLRSVAEPVPSWEHWRHISSQYRIDLQRDLPPRANRELHQLAVVEATMK